MVLPADWEKAKEQHRTAKNPNKNNLFIIIIPPNNTINISQEFTEFKRTEGHFSDLNHR
jgi:hypothetical protein